MSDSDKNDGEPYEHVCPPPVDLSQGQSKTAAP